MVFRFKECNRFQDGMIQNMIGAEDTCMFKRIEKM